jgi:hypothetical protein
MARRKRQYNTIRTDYLEQKIAFYRSTGREWEADILVQVARDVNAPIDMDEIQKMVEMYRKYSKE